MANVGDANPLLGRLREAVNTLRAHIFAPGRTGLRAQGRCPSGLMYKLYFLARNIEEIEGSTSGLDNTIASLADSVLQAYITCLDEARAQNTSAEAIHSRIEDFLLQAGSFTQHIQLGNNEPTRNPVRFSISGHPIPPLDFPDPNEMTEERFYHFRMTRDELDPDHPQNFSSYHIVKIIFAREDERIHTLAAFRYFPESDLLQSFAMEETYSRNGNPSSSWVVLRGSIDPSYQPSESNERLNLLLTHDNTCIILLRE